MIIILKFYCNDVKKKLFISTFKIEKKRKGTMFLSYFLTFLYTINAAAANPNKQASTPKPGVITVGGIP